MKRHRWFLLLTGLTLVLSTGVGMFLWHWVQSTSLYTVEIAVSHLTPIMSIVRLGLIALVAGLWNPAVQRYARHCRLDMTRRHRLMGLRWRTVTWLMVLELVIRSGDPLHTLLGALGEPHGG